MDKNANIGPGDPLDAVRKSLEGIFLSKDKEVAASLPDASLRGSDYHKYSLKMNILLEAMRHYGVAAGRGIHADESTAIENLVTKYIQERLEGNQAVFIPIEKKKVEEPVIKEKPVIEEVKPEPVIEPKSPYKYPTPFKPDNDTDLRRTQAMMILIIQTIDESVFTFKDPSKFGYEEVDGRSIFVVEENDGLFNARHTFIRENIVCITEKKHKS